MLLRLYRTLFAQRSIDKRGELEGLWLRPGGELAKMWIKIFLAVFLLTSLICSKLDSGTAVF